ncbi:MAG: thioredoxin-dependent thiol peroxidase [Brevinemataceae bacterium]
MLKKGDKAPEFSLPQADGTIISLSDYKGKWLILYSYPKDNTPACSKQSVEFSDMLPEFQQLGVEILGINRDSVESHQHFIQKKGLKFPLLSDTEKTVLQAYYIWGEKKFMNNVYEGLSRSTFVINPEGMIEEAFYNIKAAGHVARMYKFMSQLLK